MAGKAATLKILGNNLDAREKLAQIKEEADRLREDNPELTVKINRAQAMAEMAVLKEQLKTEADEPISFKVRIQNAKESIGSAGAGLGSGLLGLGAVSAAIGPLPVILGGAAAGAVGLGAALVPVVAGVGLFGAVVKSGITQVETADKANKKLSGGLGELQQSVNTAKKSWTDFTNSALRNGAASTTAKAIGLIPVALKAIQPILAPTEKALDGIISKVGKGFNSSGFQRFISLLSGEAGPAITKVAGILGHLGSMAGKVVEDFAPLGQTVLGDLDKILGEADAGTDSGIQKFLTWLRTNGPTVVKTIENLGRTVLAMVKSFSSLGAINIAAFSAIASVLAKIASTKIGANALVGLLILTKVGGVVVPMIRLVLAFKELSEVITLTKIAAIGLDAVPIVLVISAIIIAIVLLVTHWNTVKKVAVQVWHDITAAVSTAFDWIKGHWPLILGILTGPIGLAVLYIVKHWDSIVSGAKAMLDNLIGFFKSLPGRILSAVGNLGSLLLNAGKSLISGLINGIENSVPGLHSALSWVTSIIPNWKGPPEKDATLLRPAGRLILGGLVTGLNDGIPALRTQLTHTTNTIANTRLTTAASTIANTRVASLAAGVNANSTLTVEWIGGAGADQKFISWLKENIRIRGGNPAVLGR